MSDRPSFCDQAAGFVHTKLADWTDLLVVFIVLAAVGIAAAGPSFILTRTVLAASVVAPAFCFLLVSRSLRQCEGVGFERIFVAAAVAAAGIWVFEVFAYFGWVESWKLFGESLTTFNINTPARGKPFPLVWALLMAGVMFVGSKHMRVNRWFYFVLVAAAATYLLWIAVGHPSHDQPWRSPDTTTVIGLIPGSFAHPTSPADPGWAFITFWGGLLTSIVKILFGVLPATLFVHHMSRPGKAASGPADDALAKARRALANALGAMRRRTALAHPAANPGKASTATQEL